ncbi:hypothetical protein WN55_04817 [Dufourea novaeangliae]|uniref:Uncharacterized protein n=1 Tax=Dufourea novaeangliae TaxID=178035 RepID=A0A154NZF5_DUFNO|nr:hypothetical protein WN55_04817 [Dufourea novaeangliae]
MVKERRVGRRDILGLRSSDNVNSFRLKLRFALGSLPFPMQFTLPSVIPHIPLQAQRTGRKCFRPVTFLS